jgi:signal-transduction protein with cAMP-binding, CBS, and nucleotidyltransferase domain
MHSLAAIFRRRVRDFPLAPILTVGGDATAQQAIDAMAAGPASAVLVLNPSGAAIGIVTEQDVVRRLRGAEARRVGVETIMSRPLRAVQAGDRLYQAIAAMRRVPLKHLPVLDGARPVGLLNLHEAYAAALADMAKLVDDLAQEQTIEGLTEVKAAQIELARGLLAESVPAPEIQALLTEINADIYRRIVDLSLREMAERGWGPPPVAFDVIVMGSGGRGESFLRPDQDNGFVLADYPDDEHNAIDPFFVELADRMTRGLDRVGIPLCKGNVMATNPLWRKTLPQWRAQTRRWAERRSGQAILNADIFFDFRAVHGGGALAGGLREHVVALARGQSGLLRAMVQDHQRHGVALGFFGRIAADKHDEQGRGLVELKMRGTLPLVGSVRLLALAHGVSEVATLDRIAALGAKDALKDDESDYLAGAFRHIAMLLLRQQLDDVAGGRPPGNFVVLDALSERERDILTDSLRAIDRFHKRVRADVTGELL